MNLPPPSPKQARILWASMTGLAIALMAGLVILVAWVASLAVQKLSSVLMPLAVGGIIAYLLDPVVDALETRGLPRARAILCVFSLALVLLAGLVASILPQIISETSQLVERIPAYATRLQQRVEYWINHPPAPLRRFLGVSATNEASTLTITNAPADALTTNAPPAAATGEHKGLLSQALKPGTIRSATGWLAQVLPQVGSWLFGQVTRVASWFGVLAGLVLIPVYAFYFLLEKRGIESNWTNYLPVAQSGVKDELVFVLRSINDCLIAFFRGQVLVAITDGVLYTIGFLCIGLPYAFLIGAVATVLTMIPFLGAIITCITALIIAFVQFGDWLHPALVLAVFGVVQTLEGLVVSPRIMGNRVGLHPLTIIVAVMVGTSLMGGILGGILAIPLTAALRAVMFRYVWKMRETKPGARAQPRSPLVPEAAPATRRSETGMD